ncbi:MAG: hypothetical protein J1F17_06910, partial [Oscillospiraceae bacterium]|nr:hypothetical protein [Oscillospiraceae bacterium]
FTVTTSKLGKMFHVLYFMIFNNHFTIPKNIISVIVVPLNSNSYTELSPIQLCPNKSSNDIVWSTTFGKYLPAANLIGILNT